MTKRLRVNQEIKAPTVRLIGADGEQLGIMSMEKALEFAKEKDLDLAEVASNVNPPVCKIIDYGKHQYHQKKVETKQRKSQKKTTVKGVRIGFKTGEHDIKIRENQARKFLEGGSVVKVTLIFKGREVIYKDLAIKKMNGFYENLRDIAQLEAQPKAHGYSLVMMLTPIKQ